MSQLLSRPNRAPGPLRDECLEWLVEVRHRRRRAINVSPAKDGAPRRHTHLETIAFLLGIAHAAASLTCASIRPDKTSGFSMQGKWPAPTTTSKAAPGMSLDSSRTKATGVEPSSSPTTQSVETLTFLACSVRSASRIARQAMTYPSSGVRVSMALQPATALGHLA